ncbi:MAG: AI-2E family transporter [Nanoarchaeota archaeon]|nr:AI-2E family transporter [Nanoarchaeota archaeon]
MEKRKGRVVTDVFFKSDEFRKYFFWGLVVILLLLSYLILKNYLITLVSAFILSYLVRPLHLKFSKKMGKNYGALLAIVVVFLVLLLPISLVLGGVIQQVTRFAASDGFSGVMEGFSSNSFVQNLVAEGQLSEVGNRISSFILSMFTTALGYIPSVLISLIIILFGMYYILTGWDDLSLNLQKYLPFKNRGEVAKEISEITKNIVYGTFFMALIEFLVAALGFYLLGVKFFFLLAVLVFFFAFIPAIGPAFVWVPTLIYYISLGNYYIAVGVAALGIVLSLIIDTILRAKVLGEKSKINPLLMIVGILGGISVFGVFGFIIGPLVLLYTVEIFQAVLARD